MEIPKYFYFRVREINKGTSVEVEDANDVDVVEVVRCKDCRFWNEFPTASSTPYIHECGCRYPRRGTSANDFCSWGERNG